MGDVVNDVYWENIDEEDTHTGTSNAGHSSAIDDYAELLNEVETELYPGCTWCSSLDFLAKLMHMKVINKWTDSSFDQLLDLLRFAFPTDTKIPSSHYEAKKKMRKIGLGYEPIHACKYDCCLFWKENIEMQNCPICGESRWKDKDTKGKKVAQKVLRYFPLTPRLKRLYSSRYTAESMRWHATGRAGEGEPMHHPVDGKSWKDFDTRYPDFARETRNVRLGLVADGFNPFDMLQGQLKQTQEELKQKSSEQETLKKQVEFLMEIQAQQARQNPYSFQHQLILQNLQNGPGQASGLSNDVDEEDEESDDDELDNM